MAHEESIPLAEVGSNWHNVKKERKSKDYGAVTSSGGSQGSLNADVQYQQLSNGQSAQHTSAKREKTAWPRQSLARTLSLAAEAIGRSPMDRGCAGLGKTRCMRVCCVCACGFLCVFDVFCGHLHTHTTAEHAARNLKARRTLLIVSALCFVFMTAEIIGGIMANSLAVLTDAAHLLSDIAGFFISVVALVCVRLRAFLCLSPCVSHSLSLSVLVFLCASAHTPHVLRLAPR